METNLSVGHHQHRNKSTYTLFSLPRRQRAPVCMMQPRGRTCRCARHICQTNANICTSRRHKFACLYTPAGTRHAPHLLSVNNFSSAQSARYACSRRITSNVDCGIRDADPRRSEDARKWRWICGEWGKLDLLQGVADPLQACRTSQTSPSGALHINRDLRLPTYRMHGLKWGVKALSPHLHLPARH